MNSYKLDSKEMDAIFLKGTPLRCRAVVNESDYLAGRLNAGTRLIVVLSNNKKYMGEIVSFDGVRHHNCVEGDLEIVRKV